MSIKLKRLVAIFLALIIEFAVIYLLFTIVHPYAAALETIMRVVSFFVVLYILEYYDEAAYKQLWLLTVLAVPLAGTILFVCFGRKRSGARIRRRLAVSESRLEPMITKGGTNECREIAKTHERLAMTLEMVEKDSSYPVMVNEGVEYFPLGDEAYPAMLRELEAAERYIYCEYFVIAHGTMWDSIEEIMVRKAREGVTVRVMYDDFGSLATFAPREIPRLEGLGIQCVRFNPVKTFTGTENYRDHRKMLIIDGKTAFSGGINLADEYINVREHFGHWKDTAFMIKGAPAGNFTHMFVEFWNAASPEDKNIPPEEYEREAQSRSSCDGYVVSYCDSPLKKENVSNDFVIDLLYQATDYIYFTTPYLILGQSLQEALMKAARRGVDVRIITPGIPDKKMIFKMTRSYYRQLIDAGVRIYEYTPGFIHAKTLVCDDAVATVGSVNLDYRSLFLNFENNSIFVDSSIVPAVKEDIMQTISLCKEQTADDVKKGAAGLLLDALLRVVAPLC